MTLNEAVLYLRTGIRRPGWAGYIKADEIGRIQFYRPLHGPGCYEVSTWDAYSQDLEADDWEVVSSDTDISQRRAEARAGDADGVRQLP
ncbi:MAG: hypothetical protein K6T78_08075 [Alicyclobacillus sp.]|nr:hypothetical protein [Alicyclobacillus sp.]